MNFKKFIGTFACIILIVSGICYNQTSVVSRNFEFTYSVIFKPTNGKKFEAWIPYPQTNEVQNISNVRIKTDLDYKILDEETHGNKYIYLYSSNGLQAQSSFDLVFKVSREEHSITKYSNVNEFNYLSGSLQVLVGNAFENIIDENLLTDSDIKGVYDFVKKGMHYGKPTSRDNIYFNEPWLSNDELYGLKQVSRDDVLKYYQDAEKSGSMYTFGNGSSMYACDIGVGNCTDYHSYFMSLCRTMDVPSRFHMGFSIPNGNEGEIKGYHCWADYYVDSLGWAPVDISEADKNPNMADYFFGTVCENRVEFMVGRDFVLKNYNAGKVNIFIYPLLEVDDVKSSNFSKSFYYKNL